MCLILEIGERKTDLQFVSDKLSTSLRVSFVFIFVIFNVGNAVSHICLVENESKFCKVFYSLRDISFVRKFKMDLQLIQF